MTMAFSFVNGRGRPAPMSGSMNSLLMEKTEGSKPLEDIKQPIDNNCICKPQGRSIIEEPVVTPSTFLSEIFDPFLSKNGKFFLKILKKN